METIYLTVVLSPLIAAVVAGLFGRQIGRKGAHTITILGVGIACLLSLYTLFGLISGSIEPYNDTIYQWMAVGGVNMEVGFLVDNLTAMMMVVVTFVSLMVHIYTIGYMHDDPGYQRFFSYISLFTFAMLMLVMSNNFLQLFFGWEAVGLVSYLLIGFWYKRPTAIFANMKAFIVNRVGDFGFLLGIAALLMFTGSLDYAETFAVADQIAAAEINILGDSSWSLLTVACICLFIGAMGKSAQVPLHVWLPDSMEGPTPISALIHAATMVTAGVFMVARMSPLFELSEAALTFVIVIGATTALFTGFMGLVQNDIKRVVAYSTLSQLGYMTVALGASAYAAGVYHLMTHAFFKALLFLAAGSVIIGLHHEQDMRKMGGLKKYMPITYWTSLAGSLALIGFPGTAGFFSKDALIIAVGNSTIAGSSYAFFCVMAGVFITALYSFRLFFLVFHGNERIDEDARHHLHESPWVVTVPLVLLAIPSLIIGWPTIGPALFGDFFEGAIYVAPAHDVLAQIDYHGALDFALHGFASPVLYLALGGVATAWYLYLENPLFLKGLRENSAIAGPLAAVQRLLENKYYLDDFNEQVLARASRLLGQGLWRGGDAAVIDGLLVNGSANAMGWMAGKIRNIQTGYLYHYAFAMVIGLCAVIAWFIW
ncbi:MAG: NADH-quinone oxidoreductase subunit L [Gammaproteobacteria bacterium]|nr:NADH-quinone oxidoreductase subunit L [Gammaproteobacteria bacterium]NND54141.1 NADH-quinone oxidoreductase subunit L [Gammaproteobacteria bacterium]